FKSPVVLTFLVPTLALLAPIRASPSLGSREIDPFDAKITSPSHDKVINLKEDLTVSLTILHVLGGTPPPWDFAAGLWYPDGNKAYLIQDVSFGTGQVSFTLQLREFFAQDQFPSGKCQIYLEYWNKDLKITKVRSDMLKCLI
ncbi:hypothetical protein BC826DRAFT_1059999, partial [Russula brevipes]